MHLLYLDDAGSTANTNEEYFVLAGVSVFEAQMLKILRCQGFRFGSDESDTRAIHSREQAMRLSNMRFVTLREDLAPSEIPSHKLLVRAGYIRRIGSGIYAYFPLMWRVLQKFFLLLYPCQNPY